MASEHIVWEPTFGVLTRAMKGIDYERHTTLNGPNGDVSFLSLNCAPRPWLVVAPVGSRPSISRCHPEKKVYRYVAMIGRFSPPPSCGLGSQTYSFRCCLHRLYVAGHYVYTLGWFWFVSPPRFRITRLSEARTAHKIAQSSVEPHFAFAGGQQHSIYPSTHPSTHLPTVNYLTRTPIQCIRSVTILSSRGTAVGRAW